jgi:hypothetical protein
MVENDRIKKKPLSDAARKCRTAIPLFTEPLPYSTSIEISYALPLQTATLSAAAGHISIAASASKLPVPPLKKHGGKGYLTDRK